MITGYFDGCCEPVNPGGTASFGAVLFRDGERIWECSEIFYPLRGRERETSNNVAEYCGFLAILEYLIRQGLRLEQINLYGDSNLVVQQMNGRWRIKRGYYVEKAREAKKLLEQFPNLTLNWIPREENSIADELSKAELLKAGVQFKIQPNV